MSFVRNLFGWGRGAAMHSGAAMTDRLLAPEQFMRWIERERVRAARHGGVFCVLAYSAAQDHWPSLNRAFEQRLRTTDMPGMLPDRRLAVILPETDKDGAAKVIADIEAIAPLVNPDSDCEVYVFPRDDERGGDDDAAGHGRRQSPDVAMPLVHGVDASQLAHLTRTHSMESLFEQPLPWWKRTLDLVGATTGLVVLLPLLGTTALAVKMTSPGPVLFAQERAGRGGKPFLMYKFRTMVQDAESEKSKLIHLNEQDGAAFKMQDDPRVTRLGRFLRSTSMDELPQLWNVLRGQMSLVGPRPLPVEESAVCQLWHRRRLDVNPGLTCIWQVEGRSRVSFDEWMRMDLDYIRRRSPLLDIRLLLSTVWAVLKREGAH